MIERGDPKDHSLPGDVGTVLYLRPRAAGRAERYLRSAPRRIRIVQLGIAIFSRRLVKQFTCLRRSMSDSVGSGGSSPMIRLAKQMPRWLTTDIMVIAACVIILGVAVWIGP
jgi:hypothetical protein